MLPKKNRADKKLVEKIFKEGRFISFSGLSFKFLNGKQSFPRISFVVPKKVEKKAVGRNLLRRQGYSILEKYFGKIPSGISGVFIFNKVVPISEIENDIKKILNKIS